MITIEQAHSAFKKIWEAREETIAVNWAAIRAHNALHNHNINELREIALRVVGDISHWRGPVAKQVRQTLKQLIADGR